MNGLLGLRSERVAAPLSATVLQRADYVVVSTPERRDFHYGNTLQLRRPPQPADLPVVLAWWAAELGAVPGIAKRVIEWEEPLDAGGAPDEERFAATADAHGLALADPNVVLRLDAVAPVPDVGARPVDEAAWPAVVAQQLADDDNPATEQFRRWRLAAFRALSAAGRGQWWAVLEDDRSVASAGLAWGDGLVTVESVIVRPDRRRRGLATGLVGAMVAAVRTRRPSDETVIVAAQGSQAERVYRRLGFVPVSRLRALEGPAP